MVDLSITLSVSFHDDFTIDVILLTYTFYLMFNIFKSQIVNHGASECAQYIVANVAEATAVVRYKNGETYKYTNVSRRALFNLILNDNISLGRWINDCLVYVDSKCQQFGGSYKYHFNLGGANWIDTMTGEMLYSCN